MLLSKAVTCAALLMVMFSAISAVPGIIRERHIIHAPIKIKTIHHYKVKKIPILIRKHLHYYKSKEEIHAKPVLEEPRPFHDDDHEGGHHDHHDFRPKPPPKRENSEGPHEVSEEEYDEPGPSREEDENYDYE